MSYTNWYLEHHRPVGELRTLIGTIQVVDKESLELAQGLLVYLKKILDEMEEIRREELEAQARKEEAKEMKE